MALIDVPKNSKKTYEVRNYQLNYPVIYLDSSLSTPHVFARQGGFEYNLYAAYLSHYMPVETVKKNMKAIVKSTQDVDVVEFDVDHEISNLYVFETLNAPEHIANFFRAKYMLNLSDQRQGKVCAVVAAKNFNEADRMFDIYKDLAVDYTEEVGQWFTKELDG